MNKLLIVWKTNNETNINNFVIPYAFNSNKHKWFDEVEVLIWGASQEYIMEHEDVQQKIKMLHDLNVKLVACKMCADNVGATELLESLGVTVFYTGVFLSERQKDNWCEVITI